MDPIQIVKALMLALLVLCAAGAGIVKKPLISVIVFASYSGIMAIVWAMLSSPDLAITEAAVGAGVSSILFYLCLKRIGGAEKEENGKPSSSPEEDEESGESVSAPGTGSPSSPCETEDRP